MTADDDILAGDPRRDRHFGTEDASRRHDARGSPQRPREQHPADPRSTAIPFAQRLSCTIAEACEATGLGRTKLYELIGEGLVSTTTIGRRRLVLVRSLQTLLEEHDTQRRPTPR
ncbi:MAG: helix-turn-helix domain-containing protein [Alphaproteobacteria bacterium]